METRRANELAETLEAAVQEANLKADGELSKVEADARRQDRKLALDRFGAALRTIDRAATPKISSTPSSSARTFRQGGCVPGRHCRVEGVAGARPAATNDITKLVIPRGTNSLLTRAVNTRKRAQASAHGDEPPVALWGGAVANAVALPIQAGDDVIAVAYAEDAEETSSQGRRPQDRRDAHQARRLASDDEREGAVAGDRV